MKNLEIIKLFEDVCKMGGVSSDLRMIHNDFIYCIDLDSTPIEKSHQTALYVLNQVAEAFEAMEAEMFPKENPEVELLKKQLKESRLLCDQQKLHIQDLRKLNDLPELPTTEANKHLTIVED